MQSSAGSSNKVNAKGLRLGLVCALLGMLLSSCSRHEAEPSSEQGGSMWAQQANQALAQQNDYSDPPSFEDAKRGFIAAPQGQVKNAQGQVIWDFDAFAFVKGQAPASVNPSLWRQALLNNHVGLFKVSSGIWQLRGFDLANMTLIEGKTGWIVVDALTSQETAAAAMAFARLHLGNKPVSALVFTHSHADHFGGALGVITADEVKRRQITVLAPSGFMAEATSENILMGSAMGRRAMYMYGSRLPHNAQGLIDNGLGKAVAFWRMGLVAPNLSLSQAQQEVMLDGVRFVFHNVPGSEAPSELTFHLPDFKAFCGAEIMGHTLHNLYTLRGAKVRDAMQWAAYLNQSLRHVENSEVVFNQHHWPVWGKEKIQDFIRKQRDTYQFIHDQTVRQINAGLNASEIAETLQLPKSLQEHLNVRGYYGTVRHNVKAVYQHYMGWFDAHPSNLDPLAPLQASQKYVELMGGVDKVVFAAKVAYEKGELRWASELLKHAVYVDPHNKAARDILARSFDQLGFMAESASWRNFYLTGALELREGPPEKGLPREGMIDMLLQTPVPRFLEAMAASLDGKKAENNDLKINLVLSDLKESYVIQIENAVMHFEKSAPHKDANATLTLTHAFFLQMVIGKAGAKDLLLSEHTKIQGSTLDLAKFFYLIDQSAGTFPIVTRP